MKLPAWLTAQVISLAAIAVLAWLLVGQCDARRGAEARAAKAGEAATLAEAGIQQAKEASRKELEAERNLSQRRLAEALKKAGIKAEPVFVASGTTGPVTVGGAALVGHPSPAPQVAQASPAAGTSSPAAGAPACLLRDGEQGEVRVSVAGAKTEAGNVVVSGEAEAWRLSPDAKLFGGPLRLDAKVSSADPHTPKHGFGLGAATVLSRSGWSVGPAVAAPVISLPFRLQAEASAALTLNPRCNEWAGTAAVIVRRR